ncbi:MAG TPA: response regulator [Candidatus Binataceae bacterium]|jgi:DNA-binding response OmpR family regulator|nr:response regulator [Candidatus Binataceae bacterium]
MAPTKTILIVDDEADLADSCARLLRSVGYGCVVANDVAGAMALFDSEHPGLVLCDITMPVSDGFEMARYVHRKSPDTPIVLMTAYHSSRSLEEARAAGASAYLRKPFANRQLVALIDSLLGRNHNGH